jgi:5'(3')-deoxyribonucleotidase
MKRGAKLNVGIDIDGVLANFWGEFTRLGNEMYGLPHQETSFNIANYSMEDWAKPEQVSNIWQRFLDDGHYRNLDVLNEAGAQRVRELSENLDVTVTYITARQDNRDVRKDTYNWMNQRGFRGNIIHDSNKSRACNRFAVDMYVDDYDKNVADVAVNSPCNAYVLDARHNREFDLPRVHSLDEFVTLAEQYL